MSQFEIHAPLKFRKSVFSLFSDFLKATFICGLFSVAASSIFSTLPAMIVFFFSLVFSMFGICILWHMKVVEVKGNILEIRSGFWFREKKSFSMEYIQEINVKQSLLGKYLKYGDLIITAPTIDEAIVIKHLDNVRRLSKVLNDYAREQESDGFVITA